MLCTAGGVDPPAGIRAHPLLWKPPSEKAQQAQQQDSPADIRHGTARAPAPLTGFSTPQKAAMTSQDSRSALSHSPDVSSWVLGSYNFPEQDLCCLFSEQEKAWLTAHDRSTAVWKLQIVGHIAAQVAGQHAVDADQSHDAG